MLGDSTALGTPSPSLSADCARSEHDAAKKIAPAKKDKIILGRQRESIGHRESSRRRCTCFRNAAMHFSHGIHANSAYNACSRVFRIGKRTHYDNLAAAEDGRPPTADSRDPRLQRESSSDMFRLKEEAARTLLLLYKYTYVFTVISPPPNLRNRAHYAKIAQNVPKLHKSSETGLHSIRTYADLCFPTKSATAS